MTAKTLRYWLATPTGSGMDLEYCVSLVKTLKHLMREGYALPDYATGAASEIPNLHTILETMMKVTEEQVGIFWVGADHSWTPADFCRMLDAVAANPDAVIGAAYPYADGSKMVGEPLGGAVDTTKDLIPAERLGWGFTWTPFSAFQKMPPPFWLWEMNADARTGLQVLASPDVYFCHKARHYGVEVLLHRRIVSVGHGQRWPHLTALELMKRMEKEKAE